MPWDGNSWVNPPFWPTDFFSGTLQGPSFLGLEPTLHTFHEQWKWDGSDTWVAPRVADQVPYLGSGHPQVPPASPDPMGVAWRDSLVDILADSVAAMVSFWMFGDRVPGGTISYPAFWGPFDAVQTKDPILVDRNRRYLFQLGGTPPPLDIPSVNDFPRWTFAPFGFPYGDPNYGVAGNKYGRAFTLTAPGGGYSLPYIVVPDFTWGSQGWLTGTNVIPDPDFYPENVYGCRNVTQSGSFPGLDGTTGWLQSPDPPTHLDPDPASIVLWKPEDILSLAPQWITTTGASGTEPFTSYNGAAQDGMEMIGGYTKIAVVTFKTKVRIDEPVSGARILDRETTNPRRSYGNPDHPQARRPL